MPSPGESLRAGAPPDGLPTGRPTDPRKRFDMTFLQSKPFALAALALAVLVSAHCTVGKYPPDEHNKLAKPFIYDSAAADPVGVLMAGLSSVKTGQVFNISEERLEGGTETPMLSSLPDFGADAAAREATLYESLVGPFTAPIDSEAGFDHARLPPALWTEFGTVLNRAERGLFRLRDEKAREHNPLMYVEQLGLLLYGPLVLEYAPPNSRSAAIIQRLNKTPAYLETARTNLRSTSEVRFAAAWEAAQGVINLIQGPVAASMPASLKADFTASARSAVAALEEFRVALSELEATDDWRLGETLLHRKLELDTGRPLAATASLLEEAETEFEAAHKALVSAAEPINRRIYGGSRPRDDYRLINDVLEVLEGENRARNNQGMMAQMAEDAEEARKICNDEELAPVPSQLQLRVVETPEFMRISVPLAGGFGPSAATADNAAIVWLTPAPPDASRAELRDRLTTNNIFQLKLLALRYGIPGYALLGALASEMETDEKKLTHLVDPLPGFVEGWSIYITETTVGTAYTGDVDFIWRKYKLQTIAAAIVDLKMHAGDLSVSDAVRFLTRNAYMESSAARALARSIQVNPARAATAFLGWRGWQELRAHYQETTQDFSLTSFHGKALRTGSMPLVEFSYAVSEAKGRLELNGEEEGDG